MTSPYLDARRALAALALAAVAVACDSTSPVTSPVTGPGTVPVATVTVSTPSPTVVLGQTTTVTATLADAGGRPLTGREVTWTASGDGFVTVSTAGEVSAVAPGSVRIVATSEGRQGAVDLQVLPRTTLVESVSLDVTTIVLNPGETRQVEVTLRDAAGATLRGIPVTWSVEGAATAAAVSATGLVTGLEMGTATVRAVVNGRTARAGVIVLGTATHDLVFDRWYDLGGFRHVALRRLDLRTPGAEPENVLPLTSASDAAPSPDGTRIAFACAPGICVGDADGTNLKVLPGFSELTGPHGDQPVWSPDGTKIAFRGWMPGGSPGLFNPTDIWVMNVDGSNKARLTTGAAGTDYYESPSWSPRQADGSYRLAFSHATRGADGFQRATIESMRADGQDGLPVTAPGVYVDAAPTWSPDGRSIAFVRTGGDVSGDIWLVDARSGDERALLPAASEPAGAQRAPAWSPDGATIAFASNHEIIADYYAYQVYTVRADGTALVRRTSDREEKGNPAWIRRAAVP